MTSAADDTASLNLGGVVTTRTPDEAFNDLSVTFTRRAAPVDARRRVVYRTALLVLVLSYFNRDAAHLSNLHLIMWGTRTARTRLLLRGIWSGRRYTFDTTVRIDPELQVTLNLAVRDGLVETQNTNLSRVRLTDNGRRYASAIRADENLLALEKQILDELSPLSDAAVARRIGASG
jgi:hypothetical protein